MQKNVGQIYFFVVLYKGTHQKNYRKEENTVLFYDIEFTTIPKIKYNCVVVTSDYHAAINKNENLFELCYIDSGECVYQTPSGALACESGHLYPLLFGEKCEIYTESETPIKMFSIGIECGLSINVVDSSKLSEEDTRVLMKNLLAGNRFLFPKDGLSTLQFDWVLPYIKKIIACKPGERIGEETRALSLIIEFMSRITKSSMDTVAFDAKAFPTSAVAYSEMVVSYIIKNYRKKISVIEIADEFGLTPNYLHAIFKQVKGTTIIDYLTAYRMNMAKIYIERFGLRAYEAAEMVGIDDPAYFSRVFKKLYGKSVSDFKRDGN